MKNELLKEKESQETNILITGDTVIKTTGNITFDSEDIFHSPNTPKPGLLDDALSAFINGYKKYSKSNGNLFGNS